MKILNFQKTLSKTIKIQYQETGKRTAIKVSYSKAVPIKEKLFAEYAYRDGLIWREILRKAFEDMPKKLEKIGYYQI